MPRRCLLRSALHGGAPNGHLPFCLSCLSLLPPQVLNWLDTSQLTSPPCLCVNTERFCRFCECICFFSPHQFHPSWRRSVAFKGHFMTASQMERTSTIPPSPSCLLASGQEMLATTKRSWESPLRWEGRCCPSTWGLWPPREPSTRSWGQSHICTPIPMGTAPLPPSKSNSGYRDSASSVLLLFHPPVIFCCSSEITAKLCSFFFFFLHY